MNAKMYDLTNPQKLIWFTEEFYKGTPIENITGSVIIPEKVLSIILRRAPSEGNLFVSVLDKTIFFKFFKEMPVC